MEQQIAFEQVFYLGLIGVMFVAAVVLSGQARRTLLLELGRAAAARFARPRQTSEWETEQTELWLMARRRQLTEDLARVEQLIRNDAWMSATRQIGNRLARDQLVAGLRRIPDLLPGRDRYAVLEPVPQIGYDSPVPGPALSPRGPAVEVLEVGGWSRRR